MTSSKEVIFAGGGAVEDDPHSAVADVIDSGTHAIQSFPTAITGGKWGVSCITSGDSVYFAGGSVGGSKSQRHTTAGKSAY